MTKPEPATRVVSNCDPIAVFEGLAHDATGRVEVAVPSIDTAAVGGRLSAIGDEELCSMSRGGRRLSLERCRDAWRRRARSIFIDLEGGENATPAFREYYP